MTRFTAVQGFYSFDTKSEYVAGLSYNIDNEKLAALVEKWLSEGLVKLDDRVAIVAGVGTVT